MIRWPVTAKSGLKTKRKRKKRLAKKLLARYPYGNGCDGEITITADMSLTHDKIFSNFTWPYETQVTKEAGEYYLTVNKK